MNSREKRTQLFPIMLVNFIGTLGFSIVLPFLVFLVMKFGGNSIVYGLLAATYPAFQLIGAPILGRWSDIYGRKKILLLSNAGTAIGWILFLFALILPFGGTFIINPIYLGTIIIIVPLLLIFLARAIDGITGGNISVANAYLSDISSDENRSKNFGKMAISSNLGFILGPGFSWNFRWNNLWNNTTSSSSAITIFGHVSCNSLSIKRIQTHIKSNISLRRRYYSKGFFAGV